MKPLQRWTLGIVTVGMIVILILLIRHTPTIGGIELRVAELHVPFAKLQAAEMAPLRHWLAWDFVFMAIYTITLTWWTRVLAGDSDTRLAIVGRTLSWFVAFAVVFDVLENLILWVAADIGASRVSSWLPALVQLKWLPPALFVVYLAIWLLTRYVLPRMRARHVAAKSTA
jgi:hypothetical protein